MNEVLIWSLQQARKQTFALVEDLRDEQMCLQTFAKENHPAWILGHLLLGDIYLLSMLKSSELSADFMELLSKFGPNSNPNSNSKNYGSKDFLVKRLTETNLLRTNAIRKIKNLDKPTPDVTLAQTQPTIGHHLQMLVFHEGHHCGQIAAWRKAQKLSAVKGIFAS
ncbi:MAG TPA: DinB family protein [Pyrinomonadaceae bacterium]|nr:DinB family protein [Pyrinomonadaceae bacterium]